MSLNTTNLTRPANTSNVTSNNISSSSHAWGYVPENNQGYCVDYLQPSENANLRAQYQLFTAYLTRTYDPTALSHQEDKRTVYLDNLQTNFGI
jgi:hypothetical protein